MKVNKRPYMDAILVSLSGQMTGSPEEQKLIDNIQQDIQQQCRKFVIELRDIDLINTEGVRTLTNCSIAIKKNGLKLRLAAPSRMVLEALTMNSLDKEFIIFSNLERAMTSF